ncbi:hypothetical protein Lser_V15G06815 [Lactuca serriola]
MSNGDWVAFSLRHGSVELCDGLPTSIKYWKEEFFYVHAFAFSRPKAYGATTDRVADLSPELSPDELLITERLASNFFRWTDPDETVLGMAGMSPHWNRLEDVMIPDSPNHSESNMDSALEVSQSEISKSIPLNLCSKGVKFVFDRGRPPIVSTRASSTGFILKRLYESDQDDQLIQMYPPKRKRSGRETKSRSLNDLANPLILDVTGSKRNFEGPTATIFHVCPIESYSKMKHMEIEAEASHLAKLGSEDAIKNPPENPPFKEGKS